MDKKHIVKYIISIINITICTFILTLCLIYLVEFNTWQEKTISVTLTLGVFYFSAIILNRFLPTKIRILGGMSDLLSGPISIIGSITCLAYFEMWPIKILSMFIWIVLMLNLPSFINPDKE